MSRPLLLTLVSLLFALPLTAQPHSEFMREEVLPTLKEWHQEYDASLSTQQLSDLNELRAQARALREKMQEILKEVKPIMKESREKLREIYDENEDQIDEWRDEMHEMRKKSREKHGADRKKHRHAPDHRKGPAGFILGNGGRAALHFVLWDGTLPDDQAQVSRPTDVEEMSMETTRLHVTPNPGQDQIRIRANNLPDGPARVEVFDMNGQLQRSVSVQVNNGHVNQTIPTGDLAAGAYMVSVSTPKGRTSENVIVSK